MSGGLYIASFRHLYIVLPVKIGVFSKLHLVSFSFQKFSNVLKIHKDLCALVKYELSLFRFKGESSEKGDAGYQVHAFFPARKITFHNYACTLYIRPFDIQSVFDFLKLLKLFERVGPIQIEVKKYVLSVCCFFP